MILFWVRVQQAPLSQLVDGSKVSYIPLSNTVVAVVVSVLLFIHQQIVQEVQCLVDHGYFPAHQVHHHRVTVNFGDHLLCQSGVE